MMMNMAENKKILPADHYGGRKGYNIIEVVINKNPVLSISRVTQWAAVIISIYYDRIQHAMVSWCFQKWIIMLPAMQ